MTIRNGNLHTIHTTAMAARQSFVDVVTDQATYYPTGTIGIASGATDLGTNVRLVEASTKAHRQLAARADVPTKFYDRIRTGYGELWAHTMNELAPKTPTLYRTISNGPVGTLRAALSDRYQLGLDNVDVMTVLLKAFTDSGLGANDLEVVGDFDAVDGYLRLRVVVPAIAVNAKELVAKYRSPFDGRTGIEYPMIFAGLEMVNSETGDGAWTVRQRAVLQVCRNGMTRDATDQFRKVHLGSRLESGVITWSDETKQRQLELIGSAAQDAIRTFISPEYLRRIVDEASSAAGVPIVDTTAAMAEVVSTCALTDDEAKAVLDAFVRSADMSVLGLANAVTAAAQDVTDGARQTELESAFWAIVNNAEAHAGA